MNGEKRRKEAAENSTNRIAGEMLKDCVTPHVDRVADKLNAMGLKTASGLEFTRNRLTALRTKINRRVEYAQICVG